MNGKKSKQLRAQANIILVDWLKSLVNEQEARKITKENCFEMLPDQTYLYINSAFKLQPYSLRWTFKKIKAFHREFPNIKIEDIDYRKIQWIL